MPLPNPDSPGKTNICPGCGRAIPAPGHLCQPVQELSGCPHCGKPSLAGHTCPEKLRKVKFVCVRCGRLAQEQTLLCEPLELDA